MQQVEVTPHWQADRLRALIDGLRAQPDVHLPTLRRVEAKVDKLAGVRLTISRGRAIDNRLAQAKVLIGDLPATKAAARICEALGVSHSTAWRYVKRLKNV